MKHSCWSIINLTPNSFSDGGQYNESFRLESYLETIYKKSDIFDFGAESTAPFNLPISLDEEVARFEEILFPLLKKRPEFFIGKSISIDTYRPETFAVVAQEVLKMRDAQLIWNDVSGIFDSAVINLIEKYRCRYVVGHTLVPCRNKTSFHMEYVFKGELEIFLKSFLDSFKERLERCPERLKADLILDPCFGFSKDSEQNWYLLEHLKEIFSNFPKQRWLLGISRKSFLKKKLEQAGVEISNDSLDNFQQEIFFDWFSSLNNYCWDVRVHLPILFNESQMAGGSRA